MGKVCRIRFVGILLRTCSNIFVTTLFKMKAAKSSAAICPSMSAKCGSSHHAGCVAVLVSRLALPSPPPREVALWYHDTIASCDTLCRAPRFPKTITTKSLRETCEAVRAAVELYKLLLSAAAARHPLDVSEKSTLGLVAYSVIQKYFFVLGMGMSVISHKSSHRQCMG